MKDSRFTFFMILSESLVIFILFGIFLTNRETANWLLTILGISFLFAYSAGVLYPKLLNKYGEGHYKIILIIQNIILSTILYVSGNMLGYTQGYISFITLYFLICIGSYYINRRICIKEAKYLNDIIQNSKLKN